VNKGQETERGVVARTVGSVVTRLAASVTVLALCWICIPRTPVLALTASDGGGISEGPQELTLGIVPGGDRKAAAVEETGSLLKGRQQLAPDEAASYRWSYQTEALALRGSLLEVGPWFGLSGKGGGATSAERAKTLEQTLGTRRVELDAALSLAPGASLISRHDSVRNDKPGDKKRGLTTTEVGHKLRWEVGSRSQLTASLAEHSEEWDVTVGKSGVRRRERGVEFKSESGRNGVRLGLTSLETKKAGRAQLERVREAHLNLGHLTRLRLNADYVAKGSEEGADHTTQGLGAALRLTSDAELSGAIEQVSGEGSGETRESSLKLTTKLGAGSSAGELDAEERVSRGEGAKFVKQRKWALAGGIGEKGARTKLKADFKEQRGEGPSGQLARKALVHVERAFGRRLRLTAERRQQVEGTGAAPEVAVKSSCGAEAELGLKTSLAVGLVSEEDASARRGRERRVALGHKFHEMELRVEHDVREEAGGERAAVSYGVDAPAGELADWAKEISRAHEFSEAQEYLIDDGPDWMEMPFAGYRVRVKQRRGDGDDGLDTLAFAHRRMIGERHHLRLTYQERPEGKEGGQKVCPMALRRGRVEIGMPIWRGVTARGSYQRERSLSGVGGRREGVSLGLWGRLSEREQVEASVSRDGGRWEGEKQRHTSVSLLYSLEVSEGHRVHLKVGYGWDDQEAGERRRESRISLGYVKPI
jgi:hypothetical protein